MADIMPEPGMWTGCGQPTIATAVCGIMFGAYDLERDTLVGTFASKKNWTTFLAFLKWVRQKYPRHETLHVILDNATYHHKAEVLAYAENP